MGFKSGVLAGGLFSLCIANCINPVSANNGGVDPFYGDQWHLKNTGQDGGLANEDINVEPVCTAGFDGTGVRIAIIDDGLNTAHEDLHGNVVANANYNYVTQLNTLAGGKHGTAVAGLVAAVGVNDIGVRGVASNASLVAYNLLQKSSDENIADALTRGLDQNDIYNNSWQGPAGILFPVSQLARTAIEHGLSTGRNGLGAIYTKAAGNHATKLHAESNVNYRVDNANYEGYNNLRGMIVVGAVNDQGKKGLLFRTRCKSMGKCTGW
jgi:kexin